MSRPIVPALALSLALVPLAGVAIAAAPTSAATAAGIALSADTPSTTVEGNRFLAPAGWSLRTEGSAVILAPPEPDARVALIDVRAADADAAVAAAWAAFKPIRPWPLKLASDTPARDGWEQIRLYSYETSANDRMLVQARAFRRGALWTVVIGEVPLAIADKRGAQFAQILGRLLPKGQQAESFAGRKAEPLNAERIAALQRFIESAQRQLDIPGVALGLVQDGQVVHAGGLGLRALGKPEPIDADTRFLVASNTKAMTTLLLAKLVDEKKLDWGTPVTQLWPGFRLGDAATTSKVQVRHLVCACTGLPRKDTQWLLEYGNVTATDTVRSLAGLQPTSEFGALYQYSNQLAAAAGFIAGHVAYPGREPGAAYDEAMRTRVFAPLGMTATTFDFGPVLAGNHAEPHSVNVDGRTVPVDMAFNYSILPVRPTGGAWSNVRDMLRFVQLELDKGLLPDGTRHVSEQALLARREPQVKVGADASYGMGLLIDRSLGVTTVQHGGSMIGYQTGMLWMPEHDLGMVVLTNADSGGALMPILRRRLLELMFDGEPLAEAQVAALATRQKAAIAAERTRLTVPAAPEVAGNLASRYRNDLLGELSVTRERGATVFDFGEWRSEVASRRNDDGSVSLVAVAPGMTGWPELVVSDAAGRRRLTVRDSQHEYVFDEVAAASTTQLPDNAARGKVR